MIELPILEPDRGGDQPPHCEHAASEKRRPHRFWTWAHRLTAAAFLAMLVAGQFRHAPGLSGGATAVTWFSAAPVVDPLAATEVMLAARRTSPELIMGMATTLALALLLGRVFCGWLCPLGLLLELAALARRPVKKLARQFGVVLPDGRMPTSLKYWALGACAAAALGAGIPVFTAVSPINATVLGVAQGPTFLLAMLSGLFALELIWPRAFCRAICPLGALYAVVGRWAPLRIQIGAGKRLRCRQCAMHCPMGIDVMNDYVLAGRDSVVDQECTRCGVCTDVCRGAVLRLGLRPSRVTGDAPQS